LNSKNDSGSDEEDIKFNIENEDDVEEKEVIF